VTRLQGAAELVAAGAAALQAGDYLVAMRHYGAAVRRLRPDGEGGAGADGAQDGSS
jgi:hypothetical protein